MREETHQETKTVCTYAVLAAATMSGPRDRKILKMNRCMATPTRIPTCVKGKFGWDM